MERLKERVAHIGQYAVTLLKWQLSSLFKNKHENQELLFLVFLLLLVGNSRRDTVNSQVALAIQDKKDV